MSDWRCKLGLHKWEYLTPLWRKCQRCERQETFLALGFKWERYEGNEYWYAYFVGNKKDEHGDAKSDQED